MSTPYLKFCRIVKDTPALCRLRWFFLQIFQEIFLVSHWFAPCGRFPLLFRKASAPACSNDKRGLLLMLFFQYGYLCFHLSAAESRNADRQSMKHGAYRNSCLTRSHK